MKKSRYLAAASIVTFVTIGLNTSIVLAKNTFYANPDYSYEIALPDGWDITESSNETIAVGQIGDNIAFINVRVSDNDVGLHEGYFDIISTKGKVESNLDELLGGQFKNIQILDAGKSTINGQNNAWVELTGTQDGLDLKVKNFIFITKDYIYTVSSGTNPVDSYEMFKEKFSSSLSSFKITNYQPMKPIYSSANTQDEEPFYVQWIGVAILGGLILLLKVLFELISKVVKPKAENTHNQQSHTETNSRTSRLTKVPITLSYYDFKASSVKRFLNLSIDGVIIYFLSQGWNKYVVDSMTGFFPVIDHSTFSSILLVSIALSILPFALYYILFETLFGQTIGKSITGTKVIEESGNKPKLSTVIKRTLSRCIPFEALSFLGSKNPRGWHDTLSKTLVIDIKRARNETVKPAEVGDSFNRRVNQWNNNKKESQERESQVLTFPVNQIVPDMREASSNGWQEDVRFTELYRKALRHELLCRVGNIKIQNIKPFSEYVPKIDEDSRVQFMRKTENNEPALIHVYQKNDLFIMSDDYVSFYLYKDLGFDAIPCIILGEVHDQSEIDKLSKPFFLKTN